MSLSQAPHRAGGVTFLKGYVASAILHLALAAPLVLARPAQPDTDDDRLVFQLNGAVSNDQTEAQQLAQPLDAQSQSGAEATRHLARAEPAPNEDVTFDENPSQQQRPASSSQSASPSTSRTAQSGAAPMTGDEVQRKQETIAEVADEESLIKAYLKRLAKKVQTRLKYPEASRGSGIKGVATVSFTVMADGALRDGSLQMRDSSGHPALDDAALNVIRAISPMPPPPREVTLSMGISFGPKTMKARSDAWRRTAAH